MADIHRHHWTLPLARDLAKLLDKYLQQHNIVDYQHQTALKASLHDDTKHVQPFSSHGHRTLMVMLFTIGKFSGCFTNVIRHHALIF